MWKLLVDQKMGKADLRKAAGIAPNTMTKLRRNEAVSLAILEQSAMYWTVISAALCTM